MQFVSYSQGELLVRCAALAFIVVAGSSPVALAVDLTDETSGYKPATALAYDWGGFYGGPNTGGAWGHAATAWDAGSSKRTPGAYPAAGIFTPGHQPALTPNAVTGVQLGHNWLHGQRLFGLGADINHLGLTGASNFGAGSLPGSVATVRPRVGYVFDRWMVYGTGGLTLSSPQLNDGTGEGTANIGGLSASASQTRIGWTLGAGTEWIVVPNLTTKVEYLYVDLGKANANTPIAGYSASESLSSRLTANIIRFGLSYKFGSGK